MGLLRVNKFLIGILFFVTFVSCDSKKEYDSYLSMDNESWNINNSVKFKVDIEDIERQKNVFLNVRTNSSYLYRNLYVIGKMTLPNGAVLKDTLEYEMADAFGNWLGDGITDVKENKLYYLEKYKFPIKGEYVFEFSHAMRKRGNVQGVLDLEGVTDVGIRIEKTQD